MATIRYQSADFYIGLNKPIEQNLLSYMDTNFVSKNYYMRS